MKESDGGASVPLTPERVREWQSLGEKIGTTWPLFNVVHSLIEYEDGEREVHWSIKSDSETGSDSDLLSLVDSEEEWSESFVLDVAEVWNAFPKIVAALLSLHDSHRGTLVRLEEAERRGERAEAAMDAVRSVSNTYGSKHFRDNEFAADAYDTLRIEIANVLNSFPKNQAAGSVLTGGAQVASSTVEKEGGEDA